MLRGWLTEFRLGNVSLVATNNCMTVLGILAQLQLPVKASAAKASNAHAMIQITVGMNSFCFNG